MADFPRILHLIVLSGFVLPGLSLSPSLPSVIPAWSPTRLHLIDQKQSPDFASSNGGKAETEDLEFHGETADGVLGKRSDNGEKTTGQTTGTSERNNKASEVDNENQQETHPPSWIKQKEADIARDTGSSQSHRILRKRRISDHEENLFGKPRYDLLVEELPKRGRARWKLRGEHKRNWETNTRNVWEKRGLVLESIPNLENFLDIALEVLGGKRSWKSDNVIRV